MAQVELRGVLKLFGADVTAVDGLDLSAADGEFLVLLGPSGCGKTTVLRLIAGLETVSDGEILIGGRKVTDVPPRERDIAMVFQNYALYPHMTAYENIAFGLRIRKTPESEIARLIDWAAGILEIGPLLARRPKALSGGERQRIALGRALVRKPSVFLFDEPLSNLDARLRVQMRHEIIKIHRQIGTTAIYVTHDQSEAMTMGDHIAVLRDGKLQQLAAPADLYGAPRNLFVAEFIGNPAINIIDGAYNTSNSEFACPAFAFPWPASVPEPDSGQDTPLRFGIRPEDIHFQPLEAAVAIDCRIERIEILGGEHHVFMRAGEVPLVSRLGGKLPEGISEGLKLKVFFDPTDGHLFDAEAGENLRYSDL